MSKRADYVSNKHKTMDKDNLASYSFSRRCDNEVREKDNKKRKARAKRKLTGK